MNRIKRLLKQREKANKEIQKSQELLQKYEKEMDDRALELGERKNFLEEYVIPNDRSVIASQNRIDKEFKRRKRLEKNLLPIKKKLQAAKSQIKDEAITLKDSVFKRVCAEHEEKLSIYREKEKEMKEIQVQVGDLYRKKVEMQRDFNKLSKYLTDDKVGEIIDCTEIIISRDGELRRLFKTYPEVAELFESDISEKIEEYEIGVQKHAEETKKERQKEIVERKSLMEQAMKWIKNGFYPYELHSSSHLLTPDVLFSYWKGKGLSPDDYDENRVLKKKVV